MALFHGDEQTCLLAIPFLRASVERNTPEIALPYAFSNLFSVSLPLYNEPASFLDTISYEFLRIGFSE